jgi:EthD domain-containing protein
MTKRIAILRAPDGVDRDRFTRDLVAAIGSAPGIELYVTEPDPRPATAVVCGPFDHGEGQSLAIYEVDGKVMWDDPIAGPVHTMFAFFRAPEGLEHGEFVRRYREHAELARVHHPGIRRYVQDLVVSQQGEDRWLFSAISELHFAGPDEYRTRFYHDDSSRDVIAADVRRFSDGPSAKMIVAPRIPLI